MLKKGQPLQFKRPFSSMRLVLEAIENGHVTLLEIRTETKLNRGQVASAIANLAYIGAICTKHRDAQGRAIYLLPGRIETFPECLKGVKSVFHAVITNHDN